MTKVKRSLSCKRGKFCSFIKGKRKSDVHSLKTINQTNEKISKTIENIVQHRCAQGCCFVDMLKDHLDLEGEIDTSYMSPFYVEAAKFVHNIQSQMKMKSRSEKFEFMADEFKQSIQGKDNRGRFLHKWTVYGCMRPVCRNAWAAIHGIAMSTVDRCSRLFHQDNNLNTIETGMWEDSTLQDFTYGETVELFADTCLNGEDPLIGMAFQKLCRTF